MQTLEEPFESLPLEVRIRLLIQKKPTLDPTQFITLAKNMVKNATGADKARCEKHIKILKKMIKARREACPN